MNATTKRLTAEQEQDAITDFCDYTGRPADGCEVTYRDDPDTGESWYQVVDADGRGDGSGIWTPVE